MQSLSNTTPTNTIKPTKTINYGDIVYYEKDLNDFVTILNLDNTYMPIKQCENLATYLTKKYNNYHMGCWVVSIDPYSFKKLDTPEMELEYKTLFVEEIKKLILNNKIFQVNNILCVCQMAPHKGIHGHFCYFSSVVLDRDILKEITQLLNRKIVIVENLVRKSIHFISNFQIIKSTGAYFNYLQSKDKGTFYTVCSSSEIAQLIINFDKNVVFPEGSNPKKMKVMPNGSYINSNNECVLWMFKKLHMGVSDYNELLRDDNSQNYLHITNFKTIWENCYSQFTATLTHETNLLWLFTQFNNLKENELCCCAVIDLLRRQNLDLRVFCTQLVDWVLAKEKRNALVFQGPHDTFKSTFARLLWSLFLNHKRIVNDSIFSFGNAPGAGCLLWEETHISPEMADMTKLLLEGEETVSVAIKNQPSKILGKRIPIIITNNHELGVYCRHEQDNFDARCFKINFNTKCNYHDLCFNKKHYCDRIDPASNTANTPGSSSFEEDLRLESDTSVEDCIRFHKLNKNQVLNFVIGALSFYDNVDKIIFDKNTVTTTSKFLTIRDRFNKLVCKASFLRFNNDYDSI